MKNHPTDKLNSVPDEISSLNTSVESTSKSTKKSASKLKNDSSINAARLLNLMKLIEKIVDKTKEKPICEALIKRCSPYLDVLEERLELSKIQCLLLAIFINQSDDDTIRICDIARHFNCSNTSIMCYNADIEAIAAKGYIKMRKSRQKLSFRVIENALDALRQNRAYTRPTMSNLSIEDYFSYLSIIFNDAQNDEQSIGETIERMNELNEGNLHLNFCKTVVSRFAKSKNECNLDMLVVLFFCHRFVNENDDSIFPRELEDVFNCQITFNRIKNSLNNQTHTLVKEKVIETKKDNQLGERDVFHLTISAKKDLFSQMHLELEQKVDNKDIIKYSTLTSKSLFYNTKEQSQIETLSSILDDKNFNLMQQRMAENGMRKGFACLFYGAPGTGKTETVYQIARRTNRDILAVNVQQIKSMWVGQSEKNIKEVFDRYRNFVKQSQNIPILLFNEADAVLGIRRQGADNAVDKMENSIQNIILQEMENLDGIMIATTNLTQNLDAAFERRFLYKIEFDKPSIEARCAIWRSMIDSLSEQEALQLAQNYDFSGGQIENIARKRTVEIVLNGQQPSFSTIESFCQAEQLNHTLRRRPIGF